MAERDLMSWMVPRMLVVWVKQMSRVLGEMGGLVRSSLGLTQPG